MYSPRVALLLVVLWCSLRPASAAEQPAAPVPTPDVPAYTTSSHVDFSFLRDPQALRRGFLRVGGNGRLVWQDGSRARFWGVNLSNKSLWIPHAEIDRVVEVLARSGTNLVRFEALDSRGGLLDNSPQAGTRQLNADKLDTLHYWIYQLREHGIAYYLDLLDFREFSDADEVPSAAYLGRAAKPYAMFDERLIELQKEYARQLLTSFNSYTGLAPVNDPALAMVELCNEHGFFLNPSATDRMVEPYRGDLQRRWGEWLLERYGSRSALAQAWGKWHGVPVLRDTEDPARGTVFLANMSAFRSNDWDPGAAPGNRPGPSPTPHFNATTEQDLRSVPARLHDGVEFLYEVQRAYFRTMRDHLHQIGLHVPITAVVSNDVAPDLASVAAELDFLSENFYTDHPRFVGKPWQDPFYYQNHNGLRDASYRGLAPYTAALRWENKPVVVREWGTVWPNRFRAASVPEAAAYGRLQDFDGMLLFGFKTADAAERLVEFGYQADPPVWGLYALGAAMFLRGDVQPSVQSATLVYTPEVLFTSPTGVTDLHRLAWIMRLNNTLRTQPVAAKHAPRATWPQNLQVNASPHPADSVLTQLGLPPGLLHRALDVGTYESCNGQIVRRTHEGRLEVHSPTWCAIAGEFPQLPVAAGALSVTSISEVGAVVAVSLDGQPLVSSQRYLLKMVTVAHNSGQKLDRLPLGSVTDYVLSDRGAPPVRTDGASSTSATTVRINGQLIISIGLVNGTWELLVDHGRNQLWCDTPGVAANVLGQKVTTGPVQEN